MNVHYSFNMTPNCLTCLGSKSNVWNEVSVHYVEMNPLPAILIGQQKGVPQAGMIACKDRGGQYLFHQKGIYQE